MELSMVNPLSVYEDTGLKSGLARRHGDEASARFFDDWYSRAKWLETPEGRAQAEAAYRKGYKEARGV